MLSIFNCGFEHSTLRRVDTRLFSVSEAILSQRWVTTVFFADLVAERSIRSQTTRSTQPAATTTIHDGRKATK